MNRKALVVIDIQNDITKHYKDIIDRLNAANALTSVAFLEYIRSNGIDCSESDKVLHCLC